MTANGPTKVFDEALPQGQKLAICAFVLYLLRDPIVKAFEFVTGADGAVDPRVLAIIVIYAPLVLSISISVLQRRALRVAPFIIVYGLVGFAFAFTLAVHPEYESVMFDMDWSYNVLDSVFSPLAPIWVILFIAHLRSPNRIYTSLQIFVYANLLYCLVRFLGFLARGYWIAYVHTGAETQSGYSLDFGYDMLFNALILTSLALRHCRPWIHGTLAVASMTLIIIAGSRASLAIGVLGVCVLLVFHGRSVILRNRFSPVIITGIIAVFSFCALRFDLIIHWTDQILNRFGVSSRSVDAILSGDFSDDNGRQSIHGIAESLMHDSPLVGQGMYGDRIGIRDFYWWGYPHSILLEFQITFGKLTGVLILVVLAGWVMYAFISAPRDGTRDLMVLFGVQTAQLVVSNSYLYSIPFWAMIVLGYIALSRRKSLRRDELIMSKSASRISATRPT